MRRHSFFVTLFLGNLLLVTSLVAVVTAIAYHALHRHYRQTLQDQQQQLLHVVRQSIEALGPPEAGRLDLLCKRLAAPIGSATPVRFTVIAADGRVLADSHHDPATMENHRTPHRPEVVRALDGEAGWDVRRSDTLGVEYRYAAEPLLHQGRVVGAVRVAMPVTAIAGQQAVIRDVLVGAALAALAAALLLALLISWVWYAPLREITRTASQLASGKRLEPVRASGPAELVQLGAALNAMRDHLAAQIEAVSAQRADLETVIASLREGVIALDTQGTIVHMNQAARDLLAPDADAVAGKHLQAVVRLPDVVDVYQAMATQGQTVSRQIEVRTADSCRYLDVHAAPVAARLPRTALAGILVVRDVTALVQTAAIKAEFVANASHELRTPLATIRLAVDSLAQTDPADAQALARLVAILDRQVSRLEHLTADLLDLHRLESGKIRARVEPVAVADLAEWARSTFSASAAEKGLRLEVAVVPDGAAPAAPIRSDRKLLEVILQNLLHNAIKFTSAGQVGCLLERREDDLVVRVSDTGCGIRPEDQAHLFERFYQADPARSGEPAKRGTGLGLAIVKHAAEVLGAQIRLTSAVGQGTTVTVIVPDRAAP